MYFCSIPDVNDCLEPIDLLTMMIGAVVHDFEHPGRNNAFLVKTHSELAMRYNDHSVLENHHISAAYSVLSDPNCNIFVNLTESQQMRVRKTMIDFVLATDMAEHLEYVNKFGNRLSGDFDPMNNRSDLMLLMKMCLKCADLSHSSKSRELHLNWTKRVTEEFFQQGDAEKRLGMPVSPMLDRTKPGLAKSQVGFFDFAILPMYEVMGKAINIEVVLGQLHDNYEYWSQRKEEEEMENEE
eukprot:TRINITY_DN3069_c0_g1_i1.p1 TRINITY_DN3069_c0_g1~~TRINITY_DN3069_c0_g1_i1.p1  ORF type:complete len:240 (+),score=89.08 TRINITY_DN3069_c0_g1_i1:284-1003(+)